MPLELHTMRKLQFAGKKKYWELAPCNIVVVGGVEFVKLARGGTNYPFARIVFEDYQSSQMDNMSLTASLGYKQLLELRDNAIKQSAEAENADRIPAMFKRTIPDMFKRQSPAPPPKRPHIPRSKLNELLKNPDGCVEITLPACGARPPQVTPVLRTVWAGAELAVLLDLDVIEHVIEYIREAGFDESLMRQKRSETPGGIARRGDKYCVVTRVLGKRRMKFFNSIDEAIDARDRQHGDGGDVQDDNAESGGEDDEGNCE